ncbi:hypothetical protein P7J41_05515 [Streptococcus suis]|uniref:hypothetical protein n=1 Tax=Streptococcus suis TaxID=1307 RepID=UPI0038BA1FDB
MFNQRLIKMTKIGLAVILAFTFGAIGYGTALVQSKLTSQATDTKTDRTTSDDQQASQGQLTEELVKEFLIAYYTRKDLGENQGRYKPFMTEGLYTATVTEEEQPINQAYKGYVVDQVFESAQIYLNQEKNVAIVQVQYTNKLLQEKDNREGQSISQQGSATLRLNYLSEDGKLLINTIDNILLSDSSGVPVTSYSDVTTPSSTTEEVVSEPSSEETSLEGIAPSSTEGE